MKIWKTYIALVNRNCSASGNNLKDLSYWRDSLFAGTIIFVLPSCLIALVPSLYMIVIVGKPIMAVADLITIIILFLIAFMPGVTAAVRKIIFISCVYVLSCILLYFLGIHGSGLMYLFASCIFSILIFPTPYTFWSAWLNIFICAFFGLAKFLNVVPWPHDRDNSLGAWIAVSTNVIFLSFLSAALLTRVFNGLQETIDKEKQLKEELNKEQQSLQQVLILLQQKNNELEQFAYVASHDLKEPTRMVMSFMGMLKNKYSGQLDEKANTYIDFAIDGSKRMQTMISDLLELSRTARQGMVKEPVDLNDLLKEVKQNIYKLIEESHAKIIINMGLPTLTVYRVDISRLIQNLLSNAIKFRKNEVEPLVLFNANEKKEEWLFSIEDNGIGIKQDKFEKIFEIFARLHSHETHEGTGIGLAVCKKVVEHNGGRIWVESEEGKGSTFYFTIKK